MGLEDGAGGWSGQCTNALQGLAIFFLPCPATKQIVDPGRLCQQHVPAARPNVHKILCSPARQVFAEVCALCSDSHVEAKAGVYRAIGQPTEAALLVLAEKLGVPDAAAQQAILQVRRWLCGCRVDEGGC